MIYSLIAAASTRRGVMWMLDLSPTFERFRARWMIIADEHAPTVEACDLRTREGQLIAWTRDMTKLGYYRGWERFVIARKS